MLKDVRDVYFYYKSVFLVTVLVAAVVGGLFGWAVYNILDAHERVVIMPPTVIICNNEKTYCTNTGAAHE